MDAHFALAPASCGTRLSAPFGRIVTMDLLKNCRVSLEKWEDYLKKKPTSSITFRTAVNLSHRTTATQLSPKESGQSATTNFTSSEIVRITLEDRRVGEFSLSESSSCACTHEAEKTNT